MTATDELRRLLDELGVEWREHTELQGEITLWNGWQFFEGTASYNDGYSMLSMVDATPEQAVEATLGSDLKAENEKLRDAARLMWQRLRWADETMGCGVLDKRFERRLRELGVDA